jgi:hypothetical protein
MNRDSDIIKLAAKLMVIKECGFIDGSLFEFCILHL